MEEALAFVHKLSQNLVKSKFKLVTGLGLGIGSTVVDGVMQQVYREERRGLTDELVIRPFPQSTDAKKLWRQYREDMLDFAGLAVFMFGNKIAGDPPALVSSNGVIEEFEIAVSKGLRVLPLGFTGYVARELWDRVNQNFDKYHPSATDRFKALFAQLGDDAIDSSKQIDATIEALCLLQFT